MLKKWCLARWTAALAVTLMLSSVAHAQVDPDFLTLAEEQELKTLLAAVLKAKPGTSPLNLTDAEQKRQFDLTGKVAQLGLLKINKSIMEKKYAHDSDFVAHYM